MHCDVFCMFFRANRRKLTQPASFPGLTDGMWNILRLVPGLQMQGYESWILFCLRRRSATHLASCSASQIRGDESWNRLNLIIFLTCFRCYACQLSIRAQVRHQLFDTSDVTILAWHELQKSYFCGSALLVLCQIVQLFVMLICVRGVITFTRALLMLSWINSLAVHQPSTHIDTETQFAAFISGRGRFVVTIKNVIDVHHVPSRLDVCLCEFQTGNLVTW